MNIEIGTNTTGDILCAKKAAALIGCSTWTLYEYCKAGRIPHIRIGRMLRLRRSTVEAWLTDHETASLATPLRP